MGARVGLVLSVALALTVGSASAARDSASGKPDHDFLKAQAWVRSQASGVWKAAVPQPCTTVVRSKAPCLVSYKGAKLLPRGIVITPADLPGQIPWLTLNDEILEATSAGVKESSPNECDYTASGIAMGPYPGTFTQTGSIHPGDLGGSVFTGSLTIDSDIQTINADLHTPGGTLPLLPCALLASGGVISAEYDAHGSGVVDTDDGPTSWADFGNAKVWLFADHLAEAFRSDHAHEISSIPLPSSPCPPTGCV